MSQAQSHRVRLHLFPLLLIAGTVLLAYPFWFGPTAPALDDLANLNIPQRMLLAWFYHHGWLPLWNPFNFAGQPFLAAGQSGPLYPPNVVYVWMPVLSALRTSYLFHEWLAAFGMYAVVWHLTRSRLGGITSGIAFATCGFLIGHQIHTQMFDAFAWLPICFWLMLRLLDKSTALRIAVLAAAVALEVYAGHPQMTFDLFLVLGLYVLLHVVTRRNLAALRRALATLSALGLGLLLSAPQWLLTWDLTTYSDRWHVSPGYLLATSFPLSGLLQFLVPFAAGGGYSGQAFSVNAYQSLYHQYLYWESLSYVGWVPVVVGLAAALTRFWRSEPVRNLTILALIALAMAFGKHFILGSALAQLPGFDLFRVPSRYIGLVDFCLAALGGIGVASLTQPSTAVWLRRVSGWLAVGFGIVIAGVHFAPPFSASPVLAWLIPLMFAALLAVASLWVRRTTAKTLLVPATRRPVLSDLRLARYLTALALLDSLLHAAGFSRFTLEHNPAYLTPGSTVAFLRQHLSPATPFVRLAALGDTGVSMDKAASWQLPAVNGYDALEPAWYANDVALTWDSATLFAQPESWANALGVKYVVAAPGYESFLPTATMGAPVWQDRWVGRVRPDELELDGIPLGIALSSDGPLFSITFHSGQHALTTDVQGLPTTRYVVRMPHWPSDHPIDISIRMESWHGAYLLRHVKFLQGTAAQPIVLRTVNVGHTLAARRWNEVYADGNATVWENPDVLRPAWVTPDTAAPLLATSATVALRAWAPSAQTWRVQSTHAGWFVLSQMYDPNWTVLVNGHPMAVVRVNHVLTAVKIPSGISSLQFHYAPRALRIGLLVGSAGLLGWLVLAFAGIYRIRQKKTGRTRA